MSVQHIQRLNTHTHKESYLTASISHYYENNSFEDTFICPSMPVAAATIPVPPFGSLAKSFVAYALRTLWKT